MEAELLSSPIIKNNSPIKLIRIPPQTAGVGRSCKNRTDKTMVTTGIKPITKLATPAETLSSP